MDKRFRPALQNAFRLATNGTNSDRIRDAAIVFSFKAGDDMKDLAERYHIPQREVEEIIRFYMRRA